jgi:serpin B
MRKPISMLSVLCILTIILSACIPSETPSIQMDLNDDISIANRQFGFDILKELQKSDYNNDIFISPLSISIALTLAFEGAEGKTKEQIAEVLNISKVEQQELDEYYNELIKSMNDNSRVAATSLKNSLWIREGEQIKEDYLIKVEEVYDAYIDYLDFSDAESAKVINSWIEQATNGKIKDMLVPPLPANAVLYLINAIYFNADWKHQFDTKKTYESEFHSEDGGIKLVDMMNDSREIEYYSESGFEAILMPYEDEDLQMIIMLPNEDKNIDSFINELDDSLFNKVISSFEIVDEMTIHVPKFSIEYGTRLLNEELINLGMEDAFDSSANFSDIRDGIFISRVLHKAFVEVDETGSEAAAATIVEMIESAREEKIFIANRPFIFMIYDSNVDTILFLGKHS